MTCFYGTAEGYCVLGLFFSLFSHSIGPDFLQSFHYRYKLFSLFLLKQSFSYRNPCSMRVFLCFWGGVLVNVAGKLLAIRWNSVCWRGPRFA